MVEDDPCCHGESPRSLQVLASGSSSAATAPSLIVDGEPLIQLDSRVTVHLCEVKDPHPPVISLFAVYSKENNKSASTLFACPLLCLT